MGMWIEWLNRRLTTEGRSQADDADLRPAAIIIWPQRFNVAGPKNRKAPHLASDPDVQDGSLGSAEYQ